MSITVVTGELNARLEFGGGAQRQIFFPEAREEHPQRIIDKLYMKCDMYYKANTDLIVLTYSQTISDAIRLWALRHDCCSSIKYKFCMEDGTVIASNMNEYAEIEIIPYGIFNTENEILRTLLKERLARYKKKTEA